MEGGAAGSAGQPAQARVTSRGILSERFPGACRHFIAAWRKPGIVFFNEENHSIGKNAPGYPSYPPKNILPNGKFIINNAAGPVNPHNKMNPINRIIATPRRSILIMPQEILLPAVSWKIIAISVLHKAITSKYVIAMIANARKVMINPKYPVSRSAMKSRPTYDGFISPTMPTMTIGIPMIMIAITCFMMEKTLSVFAELFCVSMAVLFPAVFLYTNPLVTPLGSRICLAHPTDRFIKQRGEIHFPPEESFLRIMNG
jgi:hypothetical protein